MGGLFGGGSPHLDSTQKGYYGALTGLANQQGQIAGQAAGYGNQLLGMSTPALGNALNYWQTLLSGDRTAMSQALGPEIQQLSQGTQNALNNVSQFSPRSGARSTTMANLPFEQAQTVGNLYMALRPQAAQQVGNLGLGIGSLGTNAFGAATGAGQAGSQGYLGMLQNYNQLAQQQYQNAQQSGGALMQAILMAAAGFA